MMLSKKLLNIISIIVVVFSVIYIQYVYLNGGTNKEIVNVENLNKIYMNKMEIHKLGVDGLNIQQRFTEVTVNNVDDVKLKIKGNINYNKVSTNYEATLNTKKSIKNEKTFLDIKGNVEVNLDNIDNLYDVVKKGIISNIEKEKIRELTPLKTKIEKNQNMKTAYNIDRINKIEQEYNEKLNEKNLLKKDEFTSVLYDNIKTNIRNNLVNNEIYNYQDGKK